MNLNVQKHLQNFLNLNFQEKPKTCKFPLEASVKIFFEKIVLSVFFCNRLTKEL